MTRGKETPANVIARRLASQQWGRILHQHTLAPGIWMFSAVNSGGFVVDLDVRLELFDYQRDVMHGDKLYCDEQHFAVFEKGDTFNLPVWLYAKEILTKKNRTLWEPSDLSDEQWYEAQVALLETYLKEREPTFLKTYPSPGMGALTLEV